MAVADEPVGVQEVHILWISEGMSCDGDSVSVTAAGQPGTGGGPLVETNPTAPGAQT